MLQALVNNIGEAQSVQQKCIATYGNGAILLRLTAKMQQLCLDHTSLQARQELGHMLQLLTNLAEGIYFSALSLVSSIARRAWA